MNFFLNFCRGLTDELLPGGGGGWLKILNNTKCRKCLIKSVENSENLQLRHRLLRVLEHCSVARRPALAGSYGFQLRPWS